MKREHTAGPWNTYSLPIEDSELTVGPTLCIPVAVVHPRGIKRTEAHKANARLMAASPTLYGWLRWVRDNLITEENYSNDVTIDGMTLDEVLEKAEGGS